jgi:hypothetical protein
MTGTERAAVRAYMWVVPPRDYGSNLLDAIKEVTGVR